MFGETENRHHWGQEIVGAVLDLLFPGVTGCVACGATLAKDNEYICSTCRAQIVLISKPTCECCGRPLAYPGFCVECRLRKRSFVRCWSAAVYRGLLRRCLHRFKYDHGAYLAPFLGSLLADCLQQADGVPLRPIVVPVPLDRKRLRTRGFNQAELLATEVARLCGWPLRKKALRRLRTTLPQADLDEKDRWLNVAGAFAADGDLAGKEILLVDDIYTTGATAEAASQALVEAGAERVYVATVAMASSHPQGRANKY